MKSSVFKTEVPSNTRRLQLLFCHSLFFFLNVFLLSVPDYRYARETMLPSFHIAAILPVLLSLPCCLATQARSARQLVRRAPGSPFDEQPAMLDINGNLLVRAPPLLGFPQFENFPEGRPDIRSVEVLSGPDNFECFFWAPRSADGDYFVSPVLRAPAGEG